MKTGIRVNSQSGRMRHQVLLVAGASMIAIALSMAMGHAQSLSPTGCTSQKAADGGNGPNLRQAAANTGTTDPQKAADGGNGPNLRQAAANTGTTDPQKAADGGNGPNLRQAAASGSTPVPCKD